MYVRMWSGKVVAARSEEYLEYVRKTGVEALAKTPGNLGVLVLKRLDGETAETMVLSFWKSLESIRAFAGEQINKAVYYPEDKKFLLEMSPEVDHYEVAISENFMV